MNSDIIEVLEGKAKDIRHSTIEMLSCAGSGHTAGALGMADIFAFLYFTDFLNIDSKNPLASDRDRVVLSNGHICPVYYATLAHAGFLPIDELKTLRKFGSRLQGHPHREFFPFTETSSGPLGEGLSQAVGMAIAEKINNSESKKKIVCLMSDGELEEGQPWEAAMLAARNNLNNLIAVVDYNNIQISGNVSEVMPLESLRLKFESWNWEVVEIDGNSFEEIIDAFGKVGFDGKPSVIIAHTIPGKGVPEWEGKFEWHGKPPTKEEAREVIGKYFS